MDKGDFGLSRTPGFEKSSTFGPGRLYPETADRSAERTLGAGRIRRKKRRS